MPIIDHFEWIAPYYERFIHPQKPEKLIQLLGLPVPEMVLDAGGGTGRIAQALVGLTDRVVIADASHGMLQEAQKKQGLLACQMETEALAFPDNMFGRMIMIDALHHVANQKKTAAELLRVLQPGGRLVIEEPDIRTMGVRLMALLEKLALMRSHFLSPRKIAQLFPSKDACAQVEWDGYSAWVIVDKKPIHGNK
jgi:demethylmenaquinone methyltransferase/2-methoxy-6-polyprenyl-1,4-benzoquinol methylase